jgi:hypothetical protein
LDPAQRQALAAYHEKLCLLSESPDDVVKAVYAHYGLKEDGSDLWAKALSTRPLPADLQLAVLRKQLDEEEHRLDVVERAGEHAKQLKALLDENNKVLLNQQRLHNSYKEMGVAVSDSASEPYPPCDCIDNPASRLQFDLQVGDVGVRSLTKAYEAKLKEACNAILELADTEPARAVPDAQAQLVLEGPPQWDQFGGYTIKEGEIATEGTVGYSGKYTWRPLPKNVGKDGFAVRISVDAKADKGHRFDTGIGVKVGEGLVIEGKEGSTVELKAFAEDGKTASDTMWLMVKLPATVVKGQKYYVDIGAFYGPHVVYTFIGQ